MKDFENIQMTEFQQPIRCCNVTAIAYAISSLGFSLTVDDIFYVTKLPIASVLDDGMTLAETYDTCIKYVQSTNLPITVSLEYFDNPLMTMEKFTEIVEKAVTDPNDIHILNFNTKIAHNNPNLEGGHFSLLADYNPNSQEITVADTNPKRYTRFWQCSIEKMYKACVDKDSACDRSRGMIILRKNDN
ncbi:MAG TPA: phytochelatin synthase family protein [Nostocaceae cyanobacterium]|nr:phytochelatin synthase family protein [Nostocaceae cyanobacterium]